MLSVGSFYSELTTWDLICMIFGGTLLLCIVILSSYWYVQRRKRGSGMRHIIPSEDSICDPILSGNTIQDIIEMTTSGSGSGLYTHFHLILIQCAYNKMNIFLHFSPFSSWTSIVGATIDCTSNPVD